MLRDAAVQRINRAIGFRASGNPLETTIIDTLQEAQRDLEKGKTLPKFLIQEDQTLTLVAGQHSVALPTGFLRDVDETRIRYYETTNSVRPRFLKRTYMDDAILASSFRSETDPETPARNRAPSVYVIRRATIDFITVANQNYTLFWDYYKADQVLSSNIENLWLANASEWLIGEAGARLAADLGNQQAAASFEAMRTKGRAAVFGEILASELSSGPLQMGGNQ